MHWFVKQYFQKTTFAVLILKYRGKYCTLENETPSRQLTFCINDPVQIVGKRSKPGTSFIIIMSFGVLILSSLALKAIALVFILEDAILCNEVKWFFWQVIIWQSVWFEFTLFSNGLCSRFVMVNTVDLWYYRIIQLFSWHTFFFTTVMPLHFFFFYNLKV